jgi:DNA-binding PadR family transcriptional regulator
MLENIAMKPLSGVVRRFKELGIKVSPGYKIIEELVSLKLVTPITIDGQKLYDLTAEGRNALGKILPQSGRGGLEHRYFVERIREHYLQNEGFASVEKDDIDLVIETYGKRMAIQVETGKSDIQANLTKLGRYKADLKYMLTTNPEAEVRVKKALQELLIPDRDEIKVIPVKDFLSAPPTL